jgi:hypothetical protein
MTNEKWQMIDNDKWKISPLLNYGEAQMMKGGH